MPRASVSWIKVLVPEVLKRSEPEAGMQDWLELETQERPDKEVRWPRSGGLVAKIRKGR